MRGGGICPGIYWVFFFAGVFKKFLGGFLDKKGGFFEFCKNKIPSSLGGGGIKPVELCFGVWGLV